MGHTQLPWSVNEPPDALAIVAADGREIASMEHDTDEMTADEGEANAAFIVLAVNAHDDLLAACEALHVRLFREQGGQENSPWAAPLRLLSNAIAKAEGR
jgi:hypothetical protein